MVCESKKTKFDKYNVITIFLFLGEIFSFLVLILPKSYLGS